MGKYKLTYRKDKSQEIYLETIGKGEHAYFNTEYNEARKLIKEIIDSQKEGTSSTKYGCNNRILFTGQRGSGKTSVMHSLSHYLGSDDAESTPKDNEGNAYDVKFHCLPMVDPSHFDDNNNILLTVLTSMFSAAKKKMKEGRERDDVGEREELLKQFEKVFKSLNALRSDVKSYTLEALNSKSDAEDLKEKLEDLVCKFLKYNGKVGKGGARLVLLIDDIDMSVSHAPNMLEQLRKYLELDNLIILMSANLEQLYYEMREHYSSAFKHTLKNNDPSLSVDVEDMATKYLLKLFPTSRRISVERQVDQLLKTILSIEGANQREGVPASGKGPHIEGDLQKVILSTIWRKTRLLFVPKDAKKMLHPIIPTNLRDMAQFLDMLTTMEDAAPGKRNLFKDKEAYERCEENLQAFKHYVMHTWIPNRLSENEEKVFNNIPVDISEINKHLINSINVIGTENKKRLMSREVGLDIIERNASDVNIDRDIYTMVSPNDPRFVKANKISDIFNQPSNYSYGDLLLMIDKYETYFESEEDRRFSDAIRIYYTILLFETMFFRSNEVNYDKARYDKEKGEGADMVIPIQKLIGGNVYYPNYFEIIADKNFNQKGPSYDAKRAFYHKVSLGDGEEVGVGYPLFSVLYYGDIRPDRYEKDHIYDTTFEGNAEVDGGRYVTFDILSVLNNMLNPCHTLDRVKPEYMPQVWAEGGRNGLVEWEKFNKIDKWNIPNAILPFYAVDIMLAYLQGDMKVSDICSLPDMSMAKKLADSYEGFFKCMRPNEDRHDGFTESASQTGGVSPCEKVVENLVPRMLASVASGEELMEKEIASLVQDLLQKERYFTKDRIDELWIKMCENQDTAPVIDGCDEFVSNDDKKKIIGQIKKMQDKLEVLNGKIIDAKRGRDSSSAVYQMLSDLQEKIGNRERIAIEYFMQYVLRKEDYAEFLQCLTDRRIEQFESCMRKLKVSEDVKGVLRDGFRRRAEQEFKDVLANSTILVDEAAIKEWEDLISKYNDNYTLDFMLSRVKWPVISSEEQQQVITELATVICRAYMCFVSISLRCNPSSADSLTDLYKNHVIALILGIENTSLGKKEKEEIVRKIHRYSTVSEVFRYLVVSLWKNPIEEMCIRGVIQKNVRSAQTVKNYYGRLWKKTRALLESIFEDHSVSALYQEVFEEAEKTFLK